MNEEHNHNESFALVLFLNLFFAFIEFVAAIFSNSHALMADAIHDATDAMSILLAIYFNKKASKSANNKYTFGYKRYRLVGALITSIILIVGSVLVIINSITTLNEVTYLNTTIMFVVAWLGFLINLIGVLRLKRSEKLLSRSIMLHLLEDVLGWISLIIVSVVIYFTEWYFLDTILAIIISVFMLVLATRNLKDLTLIFLNVTPKDINIEVIKKEILSIDGVNEINDVHVYMIDEDLIDFTCHVIGNSSVLIPIREVLKSHNIVHATIQVEEEYCDVENMHFHD